MLFTIIVMFIASLGVFGLVSFMAEKRTREIGIRKVLGAESRHIIILLSGEFFRLIVISSFIAWIISWLLINEWLGQFAYHVKSSLTIYLAGASIAILPAVIITSLKAWQASRARPAETLKHD